MKWITILGVLAIVVVVIAVIIGLGSAADESQEAADRVDPEAFAEIEPGDSRREVRQALGEPESDQESEVAGIEELDVESTRFDCWYWGVLTESPYQVCFENGSVVTKSRY